MTWWTSADVSLSSVCTSWVLKDDILMLADGNGDFTRAVGLTLDGKGFGMGERSQRYSMLVKDGVVEQLNIEQGGEFKVSSAEHLLAQL